MLSYQFAQAFKTNGSSTCESFYVNADGEEAKRSAGNNVLQSETRHSCGKVGGLLTAFFEGQGADDAMSWIGFIQGEKDGDARWVMRPKIRASLQSLNWFETEPGSEKATHHLTSPPTWAIVDSVDLEEREARFALVQIRPDQAEFRRAVFTACGGSCVVSGCPVPEALEAAHLRGSSWRKGENSAGDGILLRRDLHALYDRNLLIIDALGVVQIDPSVTGTYGQFQDIQIRLPRP